MNEDTLWLQVPAAIANYGIQRATEMHQENLTRPAGSLSDLKQIALKLAALQNTDYPCIDKVNIILFAADHGMAIEEMPAFPQSVTAEMMKNFAHQGTFTRVLTNKPGAKLEIINLGTVANLDSMDGVINSILGPGTANFCQEPAMNREQLSKAINVGRQTAQRIKLNGSQLFVAGEINIENTLAATAMTCALFDILPEQLAAPGTGLNKKEAVHKTKIIRQALNHHKKQLNSPLEILRRLGGFEIAALTGSYLCCAHMGLPVLIDGYTSSVAAFIASQLCPGAEQWFLFSHTSAEPGHKIVLKALGAQPLLEHDMRPACTMHNEMTTFAETCASKKYA